MNPQPPNVGLIGLGLLGIAINQRLQEAGFSVVGFDVDPERCDQLQAGGGRPVSECAAVFAETETIILALPTSDVVEQLITDHARNLKPGRTIVDATTGDPDQMVRIANQLAGRGIHYLESNVAASSAELARGEAVLLLGGDPKIMDANAKILSALSPKQFRVGGAGCGARFKLVHNLMLGLHRAVLAEGLSFAESLGFDPSLTIEMLQQTPAASRVMDTKGAKMIQREYSPQAKLSQHLKDVRLILSLAARSGAKTPLSEVHRQLLEHAEALGYGDLDNSAVREAYRQSSEEESS